jgi:elongator complex protein 6
LERWVYKAGELPCRLKQYDCFLCGSIKANAYKGLDLDALNRAGRFTYIDGLTGLYSDASSQAPGPRKERFLRSSSPSDIKKEIEGALGDLRASRKVLIIDQLDTLLAVTDESTASLTLQNLVLGLRSVS